MSTTRQVDVFTARGEARRRWTFGDRHGCFATVCATSGACTTSTRRAEREKRLTNSKYHAGSEMSRTTYTYRAGSERRRRFEYSFGIRLFLYLLHRVGGTSAAASAAAGSGAAAAGSCGGGQLKQQQQLAEGGQWPMAGLGGAGGLSLRLQALLSWLRGRNLQALARQIYYC
eukprot:5633023-Pyramimonas_sp.AAC.1